MATFLKSQTYKANLFTTVRKEISLSLLFFLAFSISLFAQNQIDFSNVKANINKQIDSSHIPSISVAVVKNQSILWEESFGYANREKKIKATINTPYYIASVTKLFTAISIVKLSENKKVGLNNSANLYLKHSKISSPFWKASDVTIKMLLQHTSGLTTYYKECYPKLQNCHVNIDSAIDKYAIAFWKPGTYFDYSNMGYGVLGQIVSDVSGHTYASFLQKEIFDPLSMTHSYLHTGSENKNSALSYFGDSAKTLAPFDMSSSPGASAIYSSVHDLALFSIFFMNPKGNIISNKSISSIQNESVEADTTIHGIGAFRNNNFYGYMLFSSQGGTSTAQAWVQWIPSEKVAVVVLANTGSANCESIIRDVFSDILPNFKSKLASSNQTSAEGSNQSNTLSIPFKGLYSGFIHTSKDSIPVTIQFDSAKECGVSINNKKQTTVSNASWDNSNHLYFEIPGNLDIPEETGDAPYTLQVSLCPKGNELRGAVVTSSLKDFKTPSLPYWTRLSKQ